MAPCPVIDLYAPLQRQHLENRRAHRRAHVLFLQSGKRLCLVGFTLEHRASQAQLSPQRNHLLGEESVLSATNDGATADLLAGVPGYGIWPGASLAGAGARGLDGELSLT